MFSSSLTGIVKKIKNRRTIYLVLFSLLLVIITSSGTYFVLNQKKGNSFADESGEREQHRIIEEIGKFIDLPQGEKPVLARISDISALSDQPFYKNARNGDLLLVYKNAGMVILYRESESKIINLGTVASSGDLDTARDSSSVDQASKTPTPAEIRVAILNATGIAGLAKTTGDELSAKFSYVSVVETANAAGDYTETLVVDLSGKNRAASETIAKELAGKVGELPEEEEAPTGADILVILGRAQ